MNDYARFQAKGSSTQAHTGTQYNSVALYYQSSSNLNTIIVVGAPLLLLLCVGVSRECAVHVTSQVVLVAQTTWLTASSGLEPLTQYNNANSELIVSCRARTQASPGTRVFTLASWGTGGDVAAGLRVVDVRPVEWRGR